jgi:hypothetical protein
MNKDSTALNFWVSVILFDQEIATEKTGRSEDVIGNLK